jgi:ABC-2 type transport system ATP-binding protein
VARSGDGAVKLVTPDLAAFATALRAAGATIADDGGALTVEGLSSPQIGDLAARGGLRVHELTPITASLEDAFMKLTHDQVEYRPSAMPGAAVVRTKERP